MGGEMKFVETPLKGSWLVEIEPFVDERGLFARTFCQDEFEKIGFHKKIVQINHSLTREKGAVRGMHYQRPPASETKIIRCIRGKVFDVMVDIRAGSSSFLQWYGVELSKDNMRTVVIPEGFAHGFQSLSDECEMLYFHTAKYNAAAEAALNAQDPRLAIVWPEPITALSTRDKLHPMITRDFRGVAL